MQRKGGYSWMNLISMAFPGISIDELIELYDRCLITLADDGHEDIVDYMRKGLQLTKEERDIVLQIIKEESKK